MATVRIGISGWRYPPWRGVFFPKGLPQRNELAYAASIFPSVEINGSFYSLQRPSSYAAWAEATPPNFQFSVKAPRFITHIKRLREVEVAVANFFASGVLRLGEKLGPILWQFPPSFRYHAELMESFFSQLPHTGEAAVDVARRHDDHLRTEPWLSHEGVRRLRNAIEIRHESFDTPEFVEQVRRHHIAIVVADTAGKWPLIEDLTADFVYVRLHGDEVIYTSGYTDEALAVWARKINAWRKGAQDADTKILAKPPAVRKSGRDVYVYFDNDVKVRAPYDAMSLSHRLGFGPPPIELPPAGSVNEVDLVEWPIYGREV